MIEITIEREDKEPNGLVKKAHIIEKIESKILEEILSCEYSISDRYCKMSILSARIIKE